MEYDLIFFFTRCSDGLVREAGPELGTAQPMFVIYFDLCATAFRHQNVRAENKTLHFGSTFDCCPCICWHKFRLLRPVCNDCGHFLLDCGSIRGILESWGVKVRF